MDGKSEGLQKSEGKIMRTRNLFPLVGAVILTFASPVLADESGIYVPGSIRTNAGAPSASVHIGNLFVPAPDSPGGPVVIDSPSVSTNFNGGDDSIYHPPD